MGSAIEAAAGPSGAASAVDGVDGTVRSAFGVPPDLGSDGEDPLVTARALAAVEADGSSVQAWVREAEAHGSDGALRVVAALGKLHEPGSALALAVIAGAAQSKTVRKEAARSLHRLRSAGIQTPRTVTTPRPSSQPNPRSGISEAWSTVPDGAGFRILWMVTSDPAGGLSVSLVTLNDCDGMVSARIVESSRKRLNGAVSALLADGTVPWLRLPVDYAVWLVCEALALNRKNRSAVPREWLFEGPAIEAMADTVEGPLVYRTITAAAARLAPDWLSASPQLLDEPEFDSWGFWGDAFDGFAQQWAGEPAGGLITLATLFNESDELIISRAIREVVTPELRAALKRRLEETAYYFLVTGRRKQAEWAVAAAVAISHAASSPLLLAGREQRLEEHPFLRGMMERSLDSALDLEEGDGEVGPPSLVQASHLPGLPLPSTLLAGSSLR